MPTFPEPPNRKAIVEAVFARGGFDITTRDGCGRLVEAVLPELDKADPGEWFHLKKPGGGNKYNGHAVDGGVHGPTGYFVDFIGSSASEDASIAWSLDRVKDTGGPRYKGRTDLLLPPNLGGAPAPDPVATHRYDGGGHDTGTCDTCGQPRGAAVHQVPESKVPHTYDGGEQDTGFCDICGWPPHAVIHASAPTPQPDPEPNKPESPVIDALMGRVADLEIAHLELRKRLEALEQPSPEIVAEGMTERVWGHAHPFRAIVRPGRA